MIKKCKFCPATTDLYQDVKGRIYAICIKCRPIYLQDKAIKTKETFIRKHGVSNPSQLQFVKDKKKETTLKNFGVSFPSQSPTVRNKINATNIKNFGVSNVSQVLSIKEEKKRLSLVKYGTPCTLQGENVHSKTKQTLMDRYGAEHPLQSSMILDKQESTNLRLYGTKRPAQNKDVLEKTKKTNNKLYGVDYPAQVEEVKKKIRNTFKKNNWENFITRLSKKKIIPLFEHAYYINNNNKFKYKCNRCNKTFKFDSVNPIRISCTCTQNKSFYEDEIIDWLKNIHVTNIKPNKRFMENSKYKYEIDVWLPDYSLGIDFHGLYWHSDLYKEKTYHQKKFTYFKNKGIRLIQIFESEWINKTDIVKSIIMNTMGLNGKVYARKCEIKEISNKEVKYFLIDNHLQAEINSKINVGLFYKNNLIQVGSFSKNRYKKENSFELTRLATKKNITLVGGFNKIIHYFIQTYSPTKIISFADLRFFTGEGYLKNGFTHDSITAPNYFYYKEGDKTFTLNSRIKFQKHKLAKQLEVFDSTLSEYQNMLNNGYIRIFDAGNLKVIKNC